jgi:TPR repeat protein
MASEFGFGDADRSAAGHQSTSGGTAAMIRGIALAAVLTLGGALPAAAGYQEGLRAFETGDYATAYQEFHALAQQGSPDAQFVLAQMYSFGAGVPQDDAEAFTWFRRAGEGGHAEAQAVLGFLHAYGVGIEEDAFQAYFWFSLAATRANPVAEANRDKIARSLSAARRAEADRLVAERRRQAKALSRGPIPAPAATPPAAFRVQLGAFLTAENAPAVWRRLHLAQPDLLGGLRQRVQRADRGERVFHLLQVGPLADTEAATALCAALTARGVDCLVVKP